MSNLKQQAKILIVDDEWESAIVRTVRRRLEDEGWHTIAVEAEEGWLTGDDFEVAALYAIEEERPDGVLLDVRFGEHTVCCQSAEVGHFETREDYCYEACRASSLRVLL